MKKILLLSIFIGFIQATSAQNWINQAKKAVISIITYDKDGNILNNGNGFYINSDGTAIADYKLFKNAQKASVIDVEGQKYDVKYILGANEIYDVVKFKVDTNKKIAPLIIATNPSNTGQSIYVLPYSTQKNVGAKKATIKLISDVADNYKFYTINIGLEDKNVSCPVLNDAGQVIGLAQKGGADESYAIDCNYANSLYISALSANDYNLTSIGIAKDIPENAEEALVYVMMNGNNEEAVNRLIEKFPNESEGYLRRATNYASKEEFAKAESDINTYLNLSQDKAEAHYQISKLIYNVKVFQPQSQNADWDYSKALKEIDEALAINSQFAIYKKLKGDIYFASGDYDNAYAIYESLLKSDLKPYEVYSYMADCKERQGASSDEIIELLDSAVTQFQKPYPDEAAPYLYTLAIHQAEAGKFKEAVNSYNEVEHIYGGRASAEFYYNRELAEKNCRMYQQAQDDIKEALKLAPEDHDILVEFSNLHIILKDYGATKNSANQLIQLFPNDPFGYRFLGFAQAMEGDKKEARKNLLKAKELGDENAETIINKYCK